MHWGFPGGSVDHDRLSEYVDSLDFDAKRYAEIFNERTNSACGEMDVRAHLAGNAKLLDADGAREAGISTSVVEAEIPATATLWWV